MPSTSAQHVPKLYRAPIMRALLGGISILAAKERSFVIVMVIFRGRQMASEPGIVNSAMLVETGQATRIPG
jgi:hypothetical protein